MKIYICQPMRGLTKEEILKERELGIKVAHVYYPEAEIINNFFDDYDANVSPIVYLARCCELMVQADLMLMLPFYFGTPGCDIESHIAEVYGIPRLLVNYVPDENGDYIGISELKDKGYVGNAS